MKASGVLLKRGLMAACGVVLMTAIGFYVISGIVLTPVTQSIPSEMNLGEIEEMNLKVPDQLLQSCRKVGIGYPNAFCYIVPQPGKVEVVFVSTRLTKQLPMEVIEEVSLWVRTSQPVRVAAPGSTGAAQ